MRINKSNTAVVAVWFRSDAAKFRAVAAAAAVLLHVFREVFRALRTLVVETFSLSMKQQH
jgi:hypothetical protein